MKKITQIRGMSRCSGKGKSEKTQALTWGRARKGHDSPTAHRLVILPPNRLLCETDNVHLQLGLSTFPDPPGIWARESEGKGEVWGGAGLESLGIGCLFCFVLFFNLLTLGFLLLFLRQSCCVSPAGLELWSSCLSLPSAGIAGSCHPSWLPVPF